MGTYLIEDKLKVFEGGNWHYVTTDLTTYHAIKDESSKFRRRGFGSVPSRVTVGKTTWITSIFPSKNKVYLLFLKKAVRKAENLAVGDKIKVKVEV